MTVLRSNCREPVRFCAEIITAFECVGYGSSRSHRGVVRRLTLRLFPGCLLKWVRDFKFLN